MAIAGTSLVAKANSKGMLPSGRKADAKSYAGIPRVVMESEEYKRLSGSAVKLLVELSYQYKGKNNGDLTTALHVLKHRGWKARGTIEKARGELLEADLIVCTREGKFMNPGGMCGLYGIRWRPINENPSKFFMDDIPNEKKRPRLF